MGNSLEKLSAPYEYQIENFVTNISKKFIQNKIVLFK